MAKRRPSALNRALSTPPPTPITNALIFDSSEPPKPFFDILTPPTSPIRSRSSSNLSQHSTTLPLSQSPLNVPLRSLLNALNHPKFSTKPQGQPCNDIVTCPFDVEVLHDHCGQDQVLGYGAWSTVFKGTAHTTLSSSTSFSLLTPPSSPISSAPVVVAVKRPARSDAVPVLKSEAKILSHLSRLPSNAEFIVSFYGILQDQTSLVMAAMPTSLESYIKQCSVLAKRNLSTWNMSQPVVGSCKYWLSLAHSMISALLWLHEEAGVVHGDVKPGNFLLSPKSTYAEDGLQFQPLLIDFSSSHRLGLSDLPQNTLSAVTREYTAPELLVSSVLRDPKSTATKSSDVFSLAVTLLVAATGDTMVYPGSVFQRQAMAIQGWQVLSLVRSGENGARVPRHGVVERALEKAVLKSGMGRISAGPWLDLLEEMMRGEPRKRL